MSRDLETRLALASFKHRYNMHDLAFDHVEAQVNDSRSKQSLDDAPSVVSTACSASSSSGDSIDILPPPLSSSPAKTLPLLRRYPPAGTPTAAAARARRPASRPQYLQSPPASSAQKPSRRKRTPNQSWRTTARAPRHAPSSPLQHAPYRRPAGAGPTFALAAPGRGGPGSPPPSSPPPSSGTTANDPPLPALYHGSPPRTPPPSTQHPGLRKRKAVAGGGAGGEEGADLLLYLATSPTPATPRPRHAAAGAGAGAGAQGPFLPPSTPPGRPSHAAHLPAASPLAPFNFADYLNVTPSPAQAPFGSGRAPGGVPRTPLAAREARRKLNFDSLVPPGGSPSVGRAGLGMELGGELTS